MAYPRFTLNDARIRDCDMSEWIKHDGMAYPHYFIGQSPLVSIKRRSGEVFGCDGNRTYNWLGWHHGANKCDTDIIEYKIEEEMQMPMPTQKEMDVSRDQCIAQQTQRSMPNRDEIKDALINNERQPNIYKEALKRQVGGDHYSRMKIQPAVYADANDLDFLQGLVVKYISRHKNKDGKKDIQKIIHTCELILELQYKDVP